MTPTRSEGCCVFVPGWGTLSYASFFGRVTAQKEAAGFSMSARDVRSGLLNYVLVQHSFLAVLVLDG